MKNKPNLYLLILVIQSTFFLTTCKELDKVMMVSTGDVTNILASSATISGIVIDEGKGPVTARGVCWSTSANPNINNSKTMDGSSIGSFTSNLTGLLPGTTYYARAYASSSSGSVYGKEKSFSTKTIPAVISTDPANGANNVAINKVINATFSEPMDPSTLISSTFGLSDGVTPVAGTVTYSSSTASFTANSNFLPSKTYSCTIKKGAKNLASIPLADDYQWTFTTSPIVVPSLTTIAITSISQTTAISGGNINSDGGAAITSKGVCWSTTTNPTISDSKTIDGTGSTGFTSNITGLLPGTTYHVRAYAVNSSGTGYGDDVPFTTNPVVLPVLSTTAASSISQTTAVSGGNITSDGGGAIISKGVCWSTTTNPTISDSKTIDGTGSTGFTSNITGLLPGTTYHVRAYAVNSSGTGYGNDLPFTTNPVILPILSTTPATSISQTTAVSGGNITSDGGGAITSKGVCWSTTTNPTISDSKTIDGTGSTGFTSNITGLLPGTTYHVRAYAVNSSGTGYGNDLPFTTNPVVLPTLSTTVITSIGLATAVSGGNITNSGGGIITARGVCWATTPNPTITDPKTTDGTGTGSFTSNLSGLLTGTTYWVRAYAANSSGTAYGNQVVFNTKVADIEGNTYNTVTIGTQIWMQENLRTTKYNDNSPIPNITDSPTWSTLSSGAYCWYSNDAVNYKDPFGALYNWYAVNTGKLCPTGWRAATDGDWTTLTTYLGGEAVAGSKLKEAGTTHWVSPNTGTNESGFTAISVGDRSAAGTFEIPGIDGTWWTSTPFDASNSWFRNITYNLSNVNRNYYGIQNGFSVRCIKN